MWAFMVYERLHNYYVAKAHLRADTVSAHVLPLTSQLGVQHHDTNPSDALLTNMVKLWIVEVGVPSSFALALGTIPGVVDGSQS